MSYGAICWFFSFLILMLLAFEVNIAVGKIHMDLLGLALIPLGLLLQPLPIPVIFTRRNKEA